MKCTLLGALLFLIVVTPSFSCEKDITDHCFKGRLEIKGICSNYTIKVLEGRIDTDLFEKEWVNPQTGIRYENVFRLKSVCDFPTTIKEGDEFYFTITPAGTTDCIVCLAYYPTPEKSQSIAVNSIPCH